jgi:hypothetical protein
MSPKQLDKKPPNTRDGPYKRRSEIKDKLSEPKNERN